MGRGSVLIDGKFVSCYLVIFGGGMSKKREETGRKSFLPVGYFFVPVAHFFKRSEICSINDFGGKNNLK